MPLIMKFDMPPMGISAHLAFGEKKMKVISEGLVTSGDRIAGSSSNKL